jgi:hypothetical protein
LADLSFVLEPLGIQGVRQDESLEWNSLRASIQSILIDNFGQNVIESVKERNPVIEVASRERPRAWKSCEV